MRTFEFSVKVGRSVTTQSEEQVSRETFMAWLVTEAQSHSVIGIDEGFVLASGDDWTVDEAEAPMDRDWVQDRAGLLESTEVKLFFRDEKTAEKFRNRVVGSFNIESSEIRTHEPKDWNLKWKESFTGVEVPPFWQILPVWMKNTPAPNLNDKSRVIWVNPGAGFGTGTHETTQLCLELIGNSALEQNFSSMKILDFGSGSGILAIAAALLGGDVLGVEIDEMALSNAQENAEHNSLVGNLRLEKELGYDGESFDLIIANILRPVILKYAQKLVWSLKPGGSLILSGLIESDLPEIRQHFKKLLPQYEMREKSKGEWFSVFLSLNK